MESDGKNITQISTCGECGSDFYMHSSKVESLCPECAHAIYGYKNCEHQFENGRCTKCYWNGESSDYIKSLKKKDKL